MRSCVRLPDRMRARPAQMLTDCSGSYARYAVAVCDFLAGACVRRRELLRAPSGGIPGAAPLPGSQEHRIRAPSLSRATARPAKRMGRPLKSHCLFLAGRGRRARRRLQRRVTTVKSTGTVRPTACASTASFCKCPRRRKGNWSSVGCGATGHPRVPAQ